VGVHYFNLFIPNLNKIGNVVFTDIFLGFLGGAKNAAPVLFIPNIGGIPGIGTGLGGTTGGSGCGIGAVGGGGSSGVGSGAVGGIGGFGVG
jgi:hypothetical protein